MRRRKKKKKNGGIILRLIDVVMILLFGFISISELGKKTKIKLAKSTAVPVTAPDRESVIYIGVLPDGRFLVDNEQTTLYELTALSRYIHAEKRRLEENNTHMRIRVRANHDAPVRHAFAVVAICQDLNIPVGLDVIKTSTY